MSSFKIIIKWCLVTYVLYSYYCPCDASLLSLALGTVAEVTLPEDGKLNYTELAKKYGHKTETHDVVTEDGYILTVLRIPGRKPPVLLFHGLCDTAEEFIVRGNISLVITLANAGYEVWSGNNRGNKYGRRHIRLNPDTDKEFWDYSFHEIGYYDAAATIDFVRRKTNQTKVTIIGHSQGTTAFFVLTSSRPEYNEKIKVSIALAPGVFYNNPRDLFTSLLAAAGPAIEALVSPDVQELIQDKKTFSNFIKFTCSKGKISYVLCGLIGLFPSAGWNPAGIEPDFLNVIMGHYPSGCSRKSIMHYDQLFLRKSFSQYDYGPVKNTEKYGTEDPPNYDLKAVTMPTVLIVGKTDNFSTVKDVEHLRSILPNVVYYELLKPRRWSHIDYVYNKHLPRYLYPSIFKILQKYN